MAVDMFLKLDGIDGESADSKHKGEIEILSFSWGASQAGAPGFGGGMGSGKVNVHDFSFVHKVDKSSPALMTHACAGARIKQGVLSVRRAGEGNATGQDYLTIKFSDVLISSFQTGANGQAGEIPLEQVSLNFTTVAMEYKPQDAAGRLEPAVAAACGDERTAQPPSVKPTFRK